MMRPQRHRRWLAGVWLAGALLTAAPALAQEPEPDQQEEPAAVETEAGVVAYPASFFAEFRPQTAMDMLGRIPGFSFDGGSGARGFAGNAGNVLIDGERPPSRGDSLDQVVSRIPASSVERIDLVRGGAGGIDMQGKVLVANIIRKPDTGVKGSISGQIRVSQDGVFQPNGQLQLQRNKDGRALEGAVSFNRGGNNIDNHRVRLDPSDVLLLDSLADGQFRYKIMSTTGSYEGPLGAGRLRVNGQVSGERNHFDNTQTLVVPGGAEVTANAYQRLGGEAGLRYTRKIFFDIGLEAVAFQRLRHEESDNNFSTPAFTSSSLSNTDSGETIVSGKLQPKAWGKWTFETGAESAFNFVESDTDYGFNGAVLRLQGDASRVEELRSEVFGTATWAPSAKLTVESGVRYEQSTITASGSAGASEKSLGFVKPRLNVTWRPREGHLLNLRIERTVDQLSFGSFAASASFNTGIFGIGNPDIEPAKSWEITARYERRWGRQGSLVLELAHEDVSDLLAGVVVLVPNPNGGPAQIFDITRNVGDGRKDQLSVRTTIELDGAGIPGGLVTLYAAQRWSHVNDAVTGLSRRFSNESPWDWSLNFSQNIVSKKISWGFGANGSARSEFFNPRNLGSNVETWGAGGSITYRPNAKVSFSAGVNNVTRVRDTSTFVLFNGPRSTGSPVYFERTLSRSTMSAFVSARRNF